MAKRRGSKPIAVRRLLFLSSKFVVSLCVLRCLFAFLRLHFQFNPQASVFAFRRRSPSLAAAYHLFEGPAKVSFLFLVRREIPLDFLWHRFFQTGDEEKFSIFIHSAPGFVFDESTTNSSFFYGRQLNSSIQVVWGESTMIEALTDPANQRFVLLSDTCVPYHSFNYIYQYITFSLKSFVDSFLNLEENRYNDAMSPTISKENWRKGSQWIALIRKHAQVVVDDDSVLHLFSLQAMAACRLCHGRMKLMKKHWNISRTVSQMNIMCRHCLQQRGLKRNWKGFNLYCLCIRTPDGVVQSQFRVHALLLVCKKVHSRCG